jgi:histidyl-tRNA synthetase
MYNNSMKISTEGYKGVRDFYPDDYKIQEYIFTVWKDVLRSFGYEQYDSSVLENFELFKQKSGEEIVNEQTYTFEDRGGRAVALRPEMTPIVARMIAKKRKTLAFPIRWFSTPNLFRYERPQRGRLREHWQLNVDLFGENNEMADVEVIEIASALMKAFGLKTDQYIIKLNDRKLINSALDKAGLDEDQAKKMMKLLDKKNKIKDFDELAKEIVGQEFKWDPKIDKGLQSIIDELKERGIDNVKFDPELVRGFDYYTGTIFEIYDTNPENPRALFGGGRYDDLMNLFSDEKIPAIGFGMGDVTLRDVLETYDLIPNFETAVDVYICTLSKDYLDEASKLAQAWRDSGVNVIVDSSGKKVGDQIKKADQAQAYFVVVLGEDEIRSKKVKVKNLETGNEKKMNVNKVPEFVLKSLL